jgi:hypothetical protein
LASALSASSALDTLFWTSAMASRTASALKSSRGWALTALMLRTELGCTTAKPPETRDAARAIVSHGNLSMHLLLRRFMLLSVQRGRAVVGGESAFELTG